MFVYKLKRKDCHLSSPPASLLHKSPTAFCFKYLIMCDQNPSEPEVLPLLISIIFYFEGGWSDMFIYNFLRTREWILFLKCVHSVKGSLQLLKTWFNPLGWDNIKLCKSLPWLWHKATRSNWFQCQRENLFKLCGWIKSIYILETFLFHLLKCC